MTNPVPEIIEITLPENDFKLMPLDMKQLDAACMCRDDLLETLSLALGSSSALKKHEKMTSDTQKIVLDALLAPFNSAMKCMLLDRIMSIAQPGCFGEEDGEKLYNFNEQMLLQYVPNDYGIKHAADSDAKKDIPTHVIDDFNDFYDRMTTAVAEDTSPAIINSILDTICQNIMLFHLGKLLKYFNSSKFDQFVKEKTTELVAYLDQELCKHSVSHSIKIVSVFATPKNATEPSPTSVASRKIGS